MCNLSVFSYLKKINKNNISILFKNIKFMMKYDINDIYGRKMIREVQKGSVLKILNYKESIEYILGSKKSVARFGDGEFSLIFGNDISFQKFTPELGDRLKEILTSTDTHVTIGINRVYFDYTIINLNAFVEIFIDSYMTKHGKTILRLIDSEKLYIAAEVTQLYQMLEDYDFEGYFKKVKEIWRNRDLVIVCGEGILNNLHYNIFDCANSIEYIYAPSKNAFSKYDDILASCSKVDINKMIVIILGPTATVLAYDLAQMGYWALDIGHIAKDYDYYMQKQERSPAKIADFFAPD